MQSRAEAYAQKKAVEHAKKKAKARVKDSVASAKAAAGGVGVGVGVDGGGGGGGGGGGSSSRGRKGSGEDDLKRQLNEMRMKNKHMELMITTLTEELSKQKDGYYDVRALKQENTKLKTENQRLQAALKSGGGGSGGGEWFGSSKVGPSKVEAKAMRKELKHEPHYGLIKGLEKKAFRTQDDQSTQSLDQYSTFLATYASVRAASGAIDDDQQDAEAVEDTDGDHRTRILHGMLLWAQAGRHPPPR